MQPVPAAAPSRARESAGDEAAEHAAVASVWAVVVVYGGEAVTAACIDSLRAQDYPRLTVLLVDNASPDGCGPRLRDRYPDIQFMHTGANLGYTGGNNRGMERAMRAGADYLLVVNNDTVLEPTCVSALVSSAERAKDAGAIAPKILFHDDPDRIWYAGGDFSHLRAIGRHRREMDHDDTGDTARLEEVTFVSGCCLLIPAAVVRRLGGFREDFFMYCEDVEWSLRVTRAGLRMYYQPAARIYHRQEASTALASPFAALHRDRNRRRLVRDHYDVWQRIAFALWFYPSRLIRCVQYLLRGDRRGALAIIAGAFGALDAELAT